MDNSDNSSRPVLDYTNLSHAPEVCVDIYRDGGMTVTVPTRRSLVLFLVWVAAQDLLEFLFVPFAAVIYLIN
jgi:hypothetical protein